MYILSLLFKNKSKLNFKILVEIRKIINKYNHYVQISMPHRISKFILKLSKDQNQHSYIKKFYNHFLDLISQVSKVHLNNNYHSI